MALPGDPARISAVLRALAARAAPPLVPRACAAAAMVLAACVIGLGVAATAEPRPAEPPPARDGA